MGVRVSVNLNIKYLMITFVVNWSCNCMQKGMNE